MAWPAIWVGLVALAFLLRAAVIRSDLPYIGYVDEGHVLHQVVNLLEGKTLDTGFYDYPSLPSYLIAGSVLAYAPLHRMWEGRSFWAEFQGGGEVPPNVTRYYDFLAPPALILCGRAVVLLLSVGAVVLAGVVGHRLGGWRTGVLALLFTALCPALVSRGAIVIVDTVSTFFALATLLFCQRLQANWDKNSAWRLAALGGGAAGLAFASKYTIGAVFLALLATIALLPAPWKVRAKLAAFAGLGLVGGALLGMPILLTKFGRVAETVRGVAGFYDTVSSETGYWGAALSPAELGLPLVAIGLAGLGLMLWHRASRSIAISWLAFAALLIGALARSDFQPFRNLLPLVPLVCLGAAFLIARAHLYVAPRWRRIAELGIAPAVAFGLAISLALPSLRDVQTRRSHIDARVEAIDWLRQNTHTGDRILALEELSILPTEWARTPAQPLVLSWPAALKALESQPFDYLVASEFNLRLTHNHPGPARQAERWQTAVAPFPVIASFGHLPNLLVPGVWRSNDERIVILRVPAAQP